MSQELINAAQKGDLDLVKALVESGADVNFIGYFSGTISTSWRAERERVIGTALSAATQYNHLAVVQYLLSKGAVVDVDDTPRHIDERIATNAVLAYCYNFIIKDRNPVIFKILLQHAKLITVTTDYTMSSIVSYYDVKNMPPFYQAIIATDAEACHILLLHEAILRNEQGLISDFLKINKKGNVVTKDSIKKHLGQRIITSQQLFRIYQAIDYLVTNKYISPSEAIDLKQVFDQNVIFQLTLEAFPEKLKPVLQGPSNRSLEELFAELVYLLYPEEDLPPNVVTGHSFAKMDKSRYNKPLEFCMNFQHPKQLRIFLDSDRATILMRLNGCKNEQGDNPAAGLLAQILLFHSNDKITDGNSRAELLSEKQRKFCLEILNKLYMLTDIEDITLCLAREQSKDMRYLQNQTKQLLETVADYQNEVTDLKDQVTSLNEKNDQQMELLKQILANQKAMLPAPSVELKEKEKEKEEEKKKGKEKQLIPTNAMPIGTLFNR